MFQAPSYQSSGIQSEANVLHLPAELRHTGSLISSVGDPQHARLELLRQRIATGTYRVSAAALAERLMTRMLTGH